MTRWRRGCVAYRNVPPVVYELEASDDLCKVLELSHLCGSPLVRHLDRRMMGVPRHARKEEKLLWEDSFPTFVSL